MADTNTEPKMYEVKLNRVVVIHEFMYRPSEHHIVDEATLKAMGDAVDHAKQI